MAMVPLHAVFRGDCLALLVAVDDHDTMDESPEGRPSCDPSAIAGERCAHARAVPTTCTTNGLNGRSGGAVADEFCGGLLDVREREHGGMGHDSDPR